MQRTVSPPNRNMRNNTYSSPRHSIVVLAFILFALSGLLLGSVVGAFTHAKSISLANTGSKGRPTPPGVAQTQSSPQTSAVQLTRLGCPIIQQPTYEEVAEATYTFSAQAVDNSGTCRQSGKPVDAPTITCRLWLTKDGDIITKTLLAAQDRLANIATLSQPLPKEISGALIFPATTPQTQFCNAHGATTWTYQIAKTVDPGLYNLVVLTDWDGKFYNWSWTVIKVRQAT